MLSQENLTQSSHRLLQHEITHGHTEGAMWRVSIDGIEHLIKAPDAAWHVGAEIVRV